MNVLEFTLLVWITSLVAGFLGALTGLGGGVVIVPVLVLVFHTDIRYAMGASLVSVIATSSGAAAAYVREGYSNIRVGMFLEVATASGALFGSFLVARISVTAIAIVFGMVLMGSAYLSSQERRDRESPDEPDRLAARLRMDGTFPALNRREPYHVHAIPLGFGLMFLAGTLSGLLGIGSGAFKVLAMDQAMRIPFKVSTTTSNFMIGVTAAASAGVYLSRGYIDPGLAMPVMLGVLLGSLAGARALGRVRSRRLRILFSCVIVAMAIEMIYGGLVRRL